MELRAGTASRTRKRITFVVVSAATMLGSVVSMPAADAVSASLHCHSANGLPDRHCTPGVTYARVTQRDIATTICKSGWTATIRPPESYTERLKSQQIAEYGYRDKRLAHYEEDHLIPLELGGSPRSAKNLWPEFDGGKIPNPKDLVENALRRAVCDGRIRLAPAQRAIARDWKTAERVLGLTGHRHSGLSCRASVSNSRPADYTTVDVYVQTGGGASVVTVAHYRTTNHRKSATADRSGHATIPYHISGATPGYRVVVDVTASLGSHKAGCSTSFTPHA
jgi:hypothetical protein